MEEGKGERELFNWEVSVGGLKGLEEGPHLEV